MRISHALRCMVDMRAAPRRFVCRGLAFVLLLAGCSADPGDSVAPDHLAAKPSITSRHETTSGHLHFAALYALQQSPAHAFTHDGAGLRARVGASAAVTLDGDHLDLTPDAHDFTLGLRTTRIGRGPAAESAPRIEGTDADGQELILTRGPIEERYLAGPLGLEQSFRLDERPSGSGLLRIETTFDGLVPEFAPDARDMVTLHDTSGAARAVYRDLAAADATGRDLPAHMEIDGASVVLVIDDVDAVYPVTVDPLVAVLQQKLLASDPGAIAFGISVSVSGDTALVGAHGSDGNAGAAYVFVRSGTTWTQQAKLTSDGSIYEGAFGFSVGLSGDTAVIGTLHDPVVPGAAYVFQRNGTTWTHQAKVFGAADQSTDDEYGRTVAISGDTIVVGAPATTLACGPGGRVYVYARSGSTWSEQAMLDPAYCYTGFGLSVTVSGDTVAVGTNGIHNGLPGSAFVFVRSGATWTQEASLLPYDGSYTQDTRVGLSGDTLLVGRPRDATAIGSTYVFVRNGGAWAQQAKLTASDGGAQNVFGWSLGISGDLAVIGAPGKANQRGAGYVFTRSGTSWTQLPPVLASDGATGDNFGAQVSVDGDTVLFGAPWKNANIGAAYVFVPRKAQGDPCTAASECASAFCVDGVCCDVGCGGGTNDCQACSVAAGAAVDGTCAPLVDGASCDDGDACSPSDTCAAGACVGGSLITCAASDQCHVAGTCDPLTGACSNPLKADGSSCNDNDACTQADTCQAGICTGANLVLCVATDDCHDVGTCDPATGLCPSPAKPDGAVCDDNDACTQSDACLAGACVGGSPVTCMPLDECHAAGTCDPASGACSNPAKPDGSPCGMGGVCTVGVCSGSSSSSSSGGGMGGGGTGGAGGGSGGGGSNSSGDAGLGGGGEGGAGASSSSSSGSGSYAFGGCGCQSTGTGGEQGAIAAGLLALGMAARRRRAS